MFRFRPIIPTDLEQVMRWRCSESVNQYMQTDIEPDLTEQQMWFEKVSSDKSCAHWIIEKQERPIGLINLAEIDLSNKQCNWGYYIGEQTHRNLGGLIPPYLYNFLFLRSEIEVLMADVLENNPMVQKLHKLHGYKDLGVLKVIQKGEQFIGLRRFQLNKGEWLSKSRFAKYLAEFEQAPAYILN